MNKVVMRIGICSLLLCFGVAHAYVPPVPYVLQRISKAHEKLRYLGVSQTVSLIRGETEEVGSLTENLHVDMKQGIVKSSAGWETHSLASALGWLLLVNSDAAEATSFFQKYRISANESRKRLQRYEGGKVAWAYSDPDRLNELWVEKDSFLPVKAITRDAGQVLEVQFSQYKAYGDGFMYPQEILILRNGAARARIKATDVWMTKGGAMTPAVGKVDEVLAEYRGVFK